MEAEISRSFYCPNCKKENIKNDLVFINCVNYKLDPVAYKLNQSGFFDLLPGTNINCLHCNYAIPKEFIISGALDYLSKLNF